MNNEERAAEYAKKLTAVIPHHLVASEVEWLQKFSQIMKFERVWQDILNSCEQCILTALDNATGEKDTRIKEKDTRIKELEAALKPFAGIAELMGEYPKDKTIFATVRSDGKDVILTVGSFRRAAAVCEERGD
jgi:hypothetical protein